jgi:2-isopropylmalate synthase
VDGAKVRALFESAYVAPPEDFALGDYQVQRVGDRVHVEASVSGKPVRGDGNGVVDAFMRAMASTHGVSAVVEAFDEFALAQGATASAMACVRLGLGQTAVIGAAFAEDTTGAALQAVLNALGRARGVSRAGFSPAAE